jgi:hypothetical protein
MDNKAGTTRDFIAQELPPSLIIASTGLYETTTRRWRWNHEIFYLII